MPRRKRTPKRPERAIDDPRVAVLMAEITAQLLPVLNEAMEFGRKRWPGEGKDRLGHLTNFMNGAVYGAVAQFTRAAYPEVDADGLVSMYAAVSEFIGELWGPQTPGDFNAAVERLVPGIGKEASHA